jgi:catechol 1,2-dioxygenase
MTTFTEETATGIVLDRMAGCRDARLKQLVTAIVTHLHAVVKEVEPTEAEWFAAIQFLTRTGQMCDDKRQEYILLSDTLGVSMLVDAINHRKPGGATESTVLGPFHVGGAPALEMGASISKDGKGDPVRVSGRVVDTNGNPIAGASLDVWQTSSDGFYDIQDRTQPEMNLRGIFTTGADGRYFFRSIKPSSYPIPTDGPVGQMLTALGRHPMRPAHIHFIVSAPGFETVTTHIFVEGDPYLESDAVFGVKSSLVVPFVRHDDEEKPYYTAEYEFVLCGAAL